VVIIALSQYEGPKNKNCKVYAKRKLQGWHQQFENINKNSSRKVVGLEFGKTLSGFLAECKK
jgi:hypothetical protein